MNKRIALGVVLLVGCGGDSHVETSTFSITTAKPGTDTDVEDDSTSSSTTGVLETTEDVSGDCDPGESVYCYTGKPESIGYGPCVEGTRICNEDGFWGDCLFEVLPEVEKCANDIDDDCDGEVDEETDEDGDGWSVCDNDCCDSETLCTSPELVNPGTYEDPDNGVDDNCDGQIDEVQEPCDELLVSSSDDAFDYAEAMGLCQLAGDNTWGVVDAFFSRADGSLDDISSSQKAIKETFGDNIEALEGEKLALFTSGSLKAVDFQSGHSWEIKNKPPQDWLQVNGGKLPSPEDCPDGDFWANDSVMLNLKVKAPTNAKSFTVDFFFFSAEFPEYVCSDYNDFFVALIDSEAPGNPEDKNIAVWSDQGQNWPMGVNIVLVADGLFTVCKDGLIGGCGDSQKEYLGCESDFLLEGTLFDKEASNNCSDGNYEGGGTGWLTMSGNVLPGEEFELRLAVWDSGPGPGSSNGHKFDSLVLLDNWVWSVDSADPGIQPPQ